MRLEHEIVVLQKQEQDALARLNSVEGQLKNAEAEQKQALEAQRSAIQAELKDIQEQIAKRENLKEVDETIKEKSETVQGVAETVIEVQNKILEAQGVKQMPDLQQYLEQQVPPNNPQPPEINKQMETVAEVHIPQPEPFMHKDPVNVMDPVANVLIVAGAAAWAAKEIVEKVKEEFKDKDVAKDWEKEINQKETLLNDKTESLKQTLNDNQMMQEVYLADKAKFDVKDNPSEKAAIEEKSEAKIAELKEKIDKEREKIDADFAKEQKPLNEQKAKIDQVNEKFDKKIEEAMDKQQSSQERYNELQAIEKERQAEMAREREIERQREIARQRTDGRSI